MEEFLAQFDDPPTAFSLSESQLEHIARSEVLYTEVTRTMPLSRGQDISRAERGALDVSLTYGEAVRVVQDFRSLAEAVILCEEQFGLTPGGTFVDLGSVRSTQGTGKAVIAAALLHPFQACIGIELLPGLHHAAEELKQRCECGPKLEFVLGSVFDVDWSRATLVFANCACFSQQQRRVLGQKAAPGTLAISVTYSVPEWHQLARLERRMSWGSATIYIQRK